jgi:hypothetical protein
VCVSGGGRQEFDNLCAQSVTRYQPPNFTTQKIKSHNFNLN